MLSHDMCAALGDEYGMLPLDMYRMARLPVHVLSGPGLPCCFSHIHGLPNVIQDKPGRRSILSSHRPRAEFSELIIELHSVYRYTYVLGLSSREWLLKWSQQGGGDSLIKRLMRDASLASAIHSRHKNG